MQYFTDNMIGPGGAQSIANALEINHSITYICLSSMNTKSPFFPPNSSLPLTPMQYSTENNIGSSGAQSIANALKINHSIIYMDLSGMPPNHPFSFQFITLTHTNAIFHRDWYWS
jgi:hypothetical protein